MVDRRLFARLHHLVQLIHDFESSLQGLHGQWRPLARLEPVFAERSYHWLQGSVAGVERDLPGLWSLLRGGRRRNVVRAADGNLLILSTLLLSLALRQAQGCTGLKHRVQHMARNSTGHHFQWQDRWLASDRWVRGREGV